MADIYTINKVKTALRISTNSFNIEISDLIDAAITDLSIAGVTVPSSLDAMVTRAIITYCKANFGDPDNYERMKSAYDEQKSMLSMATGYHTWSD